MARKTVRISKTFHVDVEPVYGDTDDTIREKALVAFRAGEAVPDESELVTLMPDET